MCVAKVVDVDLIRVLLVITAALSGNEGTVSEVFCDLHDKFPPKACS